MNKKTLSERDICTKFITPALELAGWKDKFLEEVSFTDGRIRVVGKMTTRGVSKRADYILYYKPNIPVAIVEAKDNKHTVSAGLQQALEYARILDIPSVFSSNGDGFIFHDRTATDDTIEQELTLNEFPTPAQLWERYKAYKGLESTEEDAIAQQEYYTDGSGRQPRYYQQIAINRTVEAIAKGQNRVLLVMATGTGKTYTAFQMIYRLWKSGRKKRILFLADRNALIDQTRRGDFKYFRDKMTIIRKRVVNVGGKEELVSTRRRGISATDKAYEIFLGLYQGLTGNEGIDAYKDFSPDFFDLIVVDECHRGSASDDSSWRVILDYFKGATQVGLTATPRETNTVSNSEYFGDPLYTYSLKQGIDDGFLAPYRVVRIGLNVDLEGWRPPKGKRDKKGNPVEDRIYNRSDFDRNIVVEDRRRLVAEKITEYLKGQNRFMKTIVFCVDIEHADGMRNALVKQNADLVKQNYKYVMKITGDDEEGKRELDNFINPEERYPVIATTSKLMTTGVDAQTCQLIVLDSNIQSMTEFKQIIGRGTRINEEFGKLYFTILDFRNVTDLFADPDFDGDPVRVKIVSEDETLETVEAEEEADESLVSNDEAEVEIEEPLRPKVRYSLDDEPEIVNDERKVYVNGVDVSVLNSLELTFDNDGKPILVGLKDFTRDKMREKFRSMDDFLTYWNAAQRKEVIVQELMEQGVLLDAFTNAVDRDADLFDLICHVAFDQKPLTRKERANEVKKRNYFGKYGEKSRAVLEALLDKYADEGVVNIETLDVLRVQPLNKYGSTVEIVKLFGGKPQYLEAVRELESEIYKAVA
ncbi:EcoAI/FtnUII family type I restriction enzme subunit R [Spirosoma linguale]|uniref:Type I site-specific deoxyribonuclease n=1 Tax=Spirosoma linguale (strain ATCC 33905 / DSM 74 / LMG 10896 / Claus 1) TaxID=504472 RepID=D2QLF0_SPILD|nr:Type I site-specific deoxyribonuclease [Spirosoma linguale DSM 74]